MKEKEYMRLESDSIGTMEVPEDAYYGVQALRAKENFPITGTKLHPVFIKNLAKIKRAHLIAFHLANYFFHIRRFFQES